MQKHIFTLILRNIQLEDQLSSLVKSNQTRMIAEEDPIIQQSKAHQNYNSNGQEQHQYRQTEKFFPSRAMETEEPNLRQQIAALQVENIQLKRDLQHIQETCNSKQVEYATLTSYYQNLAIEKNTIQSQRDQLDRQLKMIQQQLQTRHTEQSSYNRDYIKNSFFSDQSDTTKLPNQSQLYENSKHEAALRCIASQQEQLTNFKSKIQTYQYQVKELSNLLNHRKQEFQNTFEQLDTKQKQAAKLGELNADLHRQIESLKNKVDKSNKQSTNMGKLTNGYLGSVRNIAQRLKNSLHNIHQKIKSKGWKKYQEETYISNQLSLMEGEINGMINKVI